jgi:two-component system NtrC family sensor kinase
MFFARQYYHESKEAADTALRMDAALLLSKYYSQRKQYDSAYKYLSDFTALKEKMLSEEKIERAQNINFNESLRQQQLQLERKRAQQQYKARAKVYGLLAGLAVLVLLAGILYRNNKQKQKANIALTDQKKKIENTLSELQRTQRQLIQAEKMASLGELTAGIAHEIQNPLNFVNNFSEINKELLSEMNSEADKGNIDEVIAIAKNILDNEEKINHHGKRADAIVKSMLQHSRVSSGQNEETDINALADEYLRLAYHGLRAKDKSFNAKFETNFDSSIGKINIAPQDIGRVLLNLINNAFYAVGEKYKQNLNGYDPIVTVTTKRGDDKPGSYGVEIKVADNGKGIPQKIVDKIFQPFFTTKPTGQGTGLGLSLAYDIVKAHGGDIRVETKEGEGSEFIVQLPIQ